MANSPIFRDMFAIPQGEGGTTQIEGSCDSNPISLDHVKKDDFRHLLDVILPLHRNIPPTEPVLSKEAWIAVLGLADMWEMHKIRLHCIDKLTNMSMTSVERVILAKKFHVPRWLRTGYKELVTSENQTLSMSASERIGYRSAIGVFQLRERFKREASSYRYGSNTAEDLNVALENVFKDELAEEEAIFQTYAATGATGSATDATPVVG
ncbi:hypothetical protein C0995_009896 [Termitomyces sp. Mi166|nr:hypothetical protein C0995_009896 [Termitomyces sp. Mi166\